MARITVENAECGQALPLGLVMLKKQTAKRLSLGMPWNVVTYRQGEFAVQVKSSDYGDSITIRGGLANYDLFLIERLAGKKYNIHGYDLLLGRLNHLVQLTALPYTTAKGITVPASFTLSPEDEALITAIPEASLTVGLSIGLDGTLRCYLKDNRNATDGNVLEGYWKGVIGEATLLVKKKQNHPSWLWDGAKIPHISTNNHVTKGGIEYKYSSQQSESLAGVNSNIACAWYWRDLNDPNATYTQLFDLVASGAQSQAMFPGTTLLWMPIAYDSPGYCYATDDTIYMRVTPFFYQGNTSAHEWWTLFREKDEAGVYGPWNLYYDGFWSSVRPVDGGEEHWIFQEFIKDSHEQIAGYIELYSWFNPSDGDVVRKGLFRFWFAVSGNPMTSPEGALDIEVSDLLDVDRTDSFTSSRAQCWILDKADTQAFLFKNWNDTHPDALVADGLFLRTSGVMTPVYLPPNGRRFGDYPIRTSKSGRYLMCIEEARRFPSSATTDILLISLLTGKVRKLNRSAAYTKLFGKDIVYPFAFNEIMRKL